MSYKRTYKYLRHYLIASFSTTLLLASVLEPQIQLADAGGKSPYDSGYDHGCDDAGISDPSDRYINEPGKGPSFHTDEFMQGYNAGYNACSGGGRSDDDENGNSGGGSNDGSQSTSRSGTEPGYRLTVEVTDKPFGTSAVDIDIITENRYRDSQKVSTAGGASWTFNIPSNQGSSVMVCVDARLLYFENCRKYISNGDDITVALSADTS